MHNCSTTPLCRLALFLFGFFTVLLASNARAQVSAIKLAKPYDSRYLVAGFIDSSGMPTMIAADFNRTQISAGVIAYEYKVFLGRGPDWTMPVFERWEAPGADLEGEWPGTRGVTIEVGVSGALTASVRRPGLALDLDTHPPSFDFVAEKNDVGIIRTAHVSASVTLDGQRHPTVGVLEWVRYEADGQRSRRVNAEEAAERQRSLGGDGVFGYYDWFVLYDADGRLLQASAGTTTEDFAYRLADDGTPQTAGRIESRWLRTEDVTDASPVPNRWQIDVPDWGLRTQLHAIGEDRGRGSPDADGFRPVYRQVGVAGHAVVGGRPTQIFGMVEHLSEARPVRPPSSFTRTSTE